MNLNLTAFIQKIIYLKKRWGLCNRIDRYNLIGAHWIALYVNGDNMTYFDSFGVEHIPREVKEFTTNKHITRNIYRIQAYNSTMCGYFCMGFIYFILTRKILLDYTNSFPANKYQKQL